MFENQNILLISIILLSMYFVYKRQSSENFYGMNHVDYHKYLECCKHYGCNSWICQNYLYYVRPYMKYIGLITSIKFPQRIFSLFKRYNHKTSQFEYFYRKISEYYDYKFHRILLPGRPSPEEKKDKKDIRLRDSITDGEVILVDGEEFIVNMQSREGIPYRSYVHKSLHGSRPHYGRFFGYNAVYDKYYPYLYKRPVHYAISGGFKTTLAPYGRLILQDDKKKKAIIDIFEKEVNPHYNEYRYYIKLGKKFRKIPFTRRLINGEIVELFSMGIPEGKYKVERI